MNEELTLYHIFGTDDEGHDRSLMVLAVGATDALGQWLDHYYPDRDDMLAGMDDWAYIRLTVEDCQIMVAAEPDQLNQSVVERGSVSWNGRPLAEVHGDTPSSIGAN